MPAKNTSKLDVHITLSDLLVMITGIPLIYAFVYLGVALVIQAFDDPTTVDNIDKYIAVLGILSGPAWMVLNKFFERWQTEKEEQIESLRRTHQTEDDVIRAGSNLPTAEPIAVPSMIDLPSEEE